MQAGREVPTTSKCVPLSLPKGSERLCELCQGKAHLQCRKCRVTFYCGAEHQQADWLGIHERICELLVPIRTSTPLHPKHADYVELQLKKVELAEICRSVAQSKLSERKHLEALPAAQCCLRCSVDIYGPSTVQLVPAYLLLAEANMGLGNLALVGELLCQAEWAVLKSPDCGHSVHQQLHRSLGRLHAATGNLEEALVNFGNDIYFSSKEHGLDSPVTCAGYFLMADVFAKQGKLPIVRSLYSQMAHTWHSHLTQLLKAHGQNVHYPNPLLKASHDKGQRLEMDEMLRTMLAFQQNDPRNDPTQVALVSHCLAMLWFLGGDLEKAESE
ncbi:zinc finger MYND domain-containing protein 12 isoform X2 [Betta splendens]|uniref:Zinc finger MYND domain-containing protein 12 isoform X2 n=1 Tax=Betta splendens TaxID=158456 RepID=A0A9W2XX62_BETSP|nr:zinc finger MYND domain-containing protein 12 isoform X2 [Betta splendens]